MEDACKEVAFYAYNQQDRILQTVRLVIMDALIIPMYKSTAVPANRLESVYQNQPLNTMNISMIH